MLTRVVVQQGDKVSNFLDDVVTVNEPETYVPELLFVMSDNLDIHGLRRRRTSR